ncbi:probable phospholipid-transporting ATPase IA [Ostrinia furnacalis]|uniref:probable phospholipid-transporting ATPase IA n=1 Tax=Ostrinia furnacalis TaxID=93504 RepID=UPI00104087C8|nr:probable phospholipid-transporting ATPase IA [Ostrinia furnacalis]
MSFHSEPQGISFIETSNLDGETNLKIRQANPETARLDSTRQLAEFHATVQCESPNRHLYEFNGMLKETNAKTIPLGLDQMLLRGAMLRNTSWVYGVVVYTGHETKLMKNSTKAPLKRSSIDRQTNTHILMLFMILLALSLLSAAFNELWVRSHSDWYIGLTEAQNTHFGFNFLTFLILYNNLIPISLQVTAEIVRFFQAKFIAMDSEMYHSATDTPAMARTSNLNEELGMVKYVFSDKTGTLTCNVMDFHKCSIAEMIYNRPGESERLEDTLLYQNLMRSAAAPVIREFLTMLAICHTVIPEKVNGKINYHAASPDERALVMGAARFGFVFETRTPTCVRIRVPAPATATAAGPTAGMATQEEEYAILNVIDFTSSRKRMSVIVRTPTGEIKLYCKGADSVIYPRLAGGPAAPYSAATLAHLEHFASEGLRTLVFAVADVPEALYQVRHLSPLEHFASEGLRTLVFAVADVPEALYQVRHLSPLEHFASEGLRTLVFAVADVPEALYQVRHLSPLEHFASEGLRTLVFAVADVPEALYQVRHLSPLEHFASEGLRTLVFAVADVPEALYQVRHLSPLEHFASEGLRTLVFAVADVPEALYQVRHLSPLEHFASEGLRTLVFAVADVPEALYQEWSNTYHKASIAIQEREQKIEEAALLIENNLRLLGATAIEDKLQDGVPDTIAALLKANMYVWVLTGDKQETAINIAHSARLIHSAMPLLILNEDSLDGTRETISRHAAEFGDNLRKQNEVALIIDGKTLKYAMGCDLKKDFLDLCISCKVVVCCRVSPIQKAEVSSCVADVIDGRRSSTPWAATSRRTSSTSASPARSSSAAGSRPYRRPRSWRWYRPLRAR